ncbi:MAG: hypothetical protein JW705_06715 [Methanosarcinaceae archaeon]|nr:hypothetical protein [Methanosarcinaceae archaeon]
MRKAIVIFLLLLAIFMQPASAVTFNELDLKVAEYNENADHVPFLLKSMLGGELIHLLIEMNDGSELHINAVTEDAIITTFEEFGPEEDIGATVTVTAKESAVDQLLSSGEPMTVFYEAMEKGDIVIEPVGFVGNIKFQVVNVMLKLSDMLGLI